MANNFTNYTLANITTESTVFTGPINTQTTIIGFSVANTTGLQTIIDVKVGGVFLIKGAPVAAGGSLLLAGGDQKIVIIAGQLIQVTATNLVDIVISALEIS